MRWINKLKRYVYIYRYDGFTLLVYTFLILWFFSPLFSAGNVVFSDIDFPADASRYLDEIYGIWNNRWSTPTQLNLARLPFVIPNWLLAHFSGDSGAIFFKGFLFTLIWLSGLSMYLFSKRLISVYTSKTFTFTKVFALLAGAVYYSINPWVIYRIQHIYLLCGYALFPLALLYFFKIFDPKFQFQIIKGYKPWHKQLYRRNITDIFLFSLIFSVSCAAIHYFFFGALFMGFILLLIVVKTAFTYRKDIKHLKQIVEVFFRKVFLTLVFFLMMSFFWLGTYLYSIVFGLQATQHNINTVETLTMFSRHSTPKNILFLNSYWWPMFELEQLPLIFYAAGAVILLIIAYGVLKRAGRHHILLFLLLFVMGAFPFATGVNIGAVAPWFIRLTKIPIFGNIFRDPDKLVGLIALPFAVFVSFGLFELFHLFKENIIGLMLRSGLVLIVILSILIFLSPYQGHFVNGFYHPVQVPEAYSELNSEMSPEEKVLYMPIADNMTQPEMGYSTPFWNVNPDPEGPLKATGDFQVYNSQADTVFHHEGNAMSVGYYMTFLQYLLDRGLTDSFDKPAKAFGESHIIYHDEYLGQEKRQDFNLAILDLQKGLQRDYSNQIFTTYDLNNPLSEMMIIPSKIMTPYGFSRMESYASEDDFDLSNSGVIFSALEFGDEAIQLNANDQYEMIEKEDLLFSLLDESYFLFPFDGATSANPFLSWSKELIKNNSWRWYLQSQGMIDYPFGFDYSKGMAVTFATSKLDVPPYALKDTKGELIADFDSLLRMEQFFVPDNPQLYNVQANPYTDFNYIPTLHGEIVKGTPKNIWQVAKSGLIDAKADNPYKFELVLSGRGTQKMHLKVRFFDEGMNELGISYVVAPEENINFDRLKFYGEYVSPRDSRYMQLELLSYQRPEQKTYWWIHDIRIYDLFDYKKVNTLEMQKTFDRDQTAEVYIRCFESEKGGELKLTVDDGLFLINTKTTGKTGFVWQRVGDAVLKKGESSITITNLEGFNAVNALCFIPKDTKREVFYPLLKRIEPARQFFFAEAETDFSFKGNIQSRRAYPHFSLGKGISLQNGTATLDFDILKGGAYAVNINMNMAQSDSQLKLKLFDDEGNLIREHLVENETLNTGAASKTKVVVYDEQDDDYPYTLRDVADTMHDYFPVVYNLGPLDPGTYQLQLSFDSQVETLSDFDDLHKFKPSEIGEIQYEPPKFQMDCSACESITEEMMQHEIREGIFHIDYDRTCSCDWYDYGSRLIPVLPDHEYLIQFDARSLHVKNRHEKVYFLNEALDIVDIQYIPEVKEADKEKWAHYEHILNVPDDAAYMQLHFLCQGNRFNEGMLEIGDYSVLRFDQLICLDNVSLYENSNGKLFFTNRKINATISTDPIAETPAYTLTNPDNDDVLIAFAESPGPLWKMVLQGKKYRSFNLNGCINGYITSQSGNITMQLEMEQLYTAGIVLFLLSFPLYIILMIKRGKNEKE